MPASPPRRLVAVIPALNEAATIGEVVRVVRQHAEAVVVDDGSTDDTAALARSAGAHVVSHPSRRGYDAALEWGMRWAAGQGYDYGVTLDAAGQHRGELIAEFRRALENGAQVVAGRRDRLQRVGEAIFAGVARALWGIDDPLCGMKGYDLALYRAAGAFDSYGSIGTELLLRAARSGVSIVQVDVPTRERSGTPRFGAGLRPNVRLLRSLLLGLLRARAIPGVAR